MLGRFLRDGTYDPDPAWRQTERADEAVWEPAEDDHLVGDYEDRVSGGTDPYERLDDEEPGDWHHADDIEPGDY